MQYELHLFEQDFTRLQQHAEICFPGEAVALLFGVISEKIVHVNRVEPMQNESKTNLTNFSVNPESEYQLLIEAEERGESLVGIYHSHPAPAEPSKSDLRNMSLNPVVWLIASKLTGNWIVKAYILVHEKADEIPIKYRNTIDSNL
ncbi:MAG: M67 family metallopeptidase [Candidatus Thorarchaeota archaeon]|nr:M67 family metallopeptidase [Candidatus Thorarchaeota archaeon]TFH09016.1 MAG: M67 family peptidase [Candidatus Thorarchaeota archaeon]